jgi:hypothetical protein
MSSGFAKSAVSAISALRRSSWQQARTTVAAVGRKVPKRNLPALAAPAFGEEIGAIETCPRLQQLACGEPEHIPLVNPLTHQV